MSITSVQSKIKAAMKDSFITSKEAQGIVKEAQKNTVTLGEAKAVAALFDRGTRIPPPGMMVTLAIPESPGSVTLEAGAKNVLETFFFKNNIPTGANREFVKAQARLTLDNATLGTKLAKAPNVKNHFPISLTNPRDVMRDAPNRMAYIDSKKQEMFVCIEGGFVRDPSPKWYGPIKLENVGWTEAVGEGPGDVVAVGGG